MTITQGAAQADAMDVGFMNAQRHELSNRRRAHHEEVVRLSAAAAELLDDRGPGDGGDGEDFGEGDSHGVELDRLLALATGVRHRLEEVDAALARLDLGTYGYCQSCGQSIGRDRLEALPETTSCIACKAGAVTLLR